MNELPHIERVQAEILNLYRTALNEPGVVEAYFDQSRGNLDMALAAQIFDELAYKEIFRSTGGNMETFHNLVTANAIYNKVLSDWPATYYLRKLVSEGVVHLFEMPKRKNPVYAVKEKYRDVLSELLSQD